MAKIIGAIAASHTPTIGFAYDRQKQNDPVWKPIFEAFEPVQQWLADKKPDVLFVIFNDHVTSFFFDHYSAFSLGVDESYAVADEGGGARDLPPVKGHAGARAAYRRGSGGRRIRHVVLSGAPARPWLFSPLSMMWPHEPHGRARSCRCRSACCNSRFRPPRAATSSASRCAWRSRAIRRTSRSRWSRPAACRTRCMASAPASTTPRGMSSSST